MEYNENYVLKGLLGISIPFDSIQTLKEFIQEQVENYKILKDEAGGASNAIKTVYSRLTQVQTSLDQMLHYMSVLQPIPVNISQQFQSILNALASEWLPYDHQAIRSLLLCTKEYGAAGEQAFLIVLKGSFIAPKNYAAMMGAFLASDFLSTRLKVDEVSGYDQGFIEKTYSSIKEKGVELDALRDSLAYRNAEWEEQTKNHWEEFVADKENFIDSTILDKSADLDAKEQQFEDHYNEFIHNAREKVSDLEKTYQEHLKLEKPAEYWSKAADKYSNHSALYGVLLFAAVLVGLVVFVRFYSNFLTGHELGVELDTIKGVVLFFTGIAVYGFFLRVVARLFMSATHLQRDAEERAQLTYFYLALIKDGVIDEKSRDIVIQSLFSRTETGLLGGDSSPTMPAMDVLKNIKLGN